MNRAAEPSQPREEPHVALDYRAQKYLEGEAGSQLNALQRAQFSELVKDPSTLGSYAKDGSTNEEIAAIFGLPIAAITQFETVLLESRAHLALRIRRQLLDAGERHNWEALNYLASNYLKGTNTSAGTAP